MARHGKARQGKARQGKGTPRQARQGKARQGKARRHFDQTHRYCGSRYMISATVHHEVMSSMRCPAKEMRLLFQKGSENILLYLIAMGQIATSAVQRTRAGTSATTGACVRTSTL